MSLATPPQSEIDVGCSTIRALLHEQHPDLAHLRVIDLGEGWDNRLFRLGDHLAVRVPRRAMAAPLIANEQRWVPELSPRLPLPVPALHRVGRPGCGVPWPWSITAWLPGEPALVVPPEDVLAAAVALGGFLHALHRPAPNDAPSNPWRSVPLAARSQTLREHLQRVRGLVDEAAVLDVWARLVATPAWSGPPSWIHGDLHPGNLLVSNGRLSGVIDFGDLASGDPATDLSVMWMLLPASARPAFVSAARGEPGPGDDHTIARARGWALALGLAYLANGHNDRNMGALGLATVSAALNEPEQPPQHQPG